MTEILSLPSLPAIAFASLPAATANANLIAACLDYPGVGLTLVRSDGTAWFPMGREQGLSNYPQAGAANNRYYPLGAVNGASLTNAAPPAGAIRAVPFFANKSINQIGFIVTTAAAGTFGICGIYEAALTSGANAGLWLPSSLLLAGSSLGADTTGGKVTSVAFSPVPGKLYWAAFHASASSMQVRSIPAAACAPLGGDLSVSLSSAVCYQVNRAYDGTMPATFPSGGAFLANTPIAVVARFS